MEKRGKKKTQNKPNRWSFNETVPFHFAQLKKKNKTCYVCSLMFMRYLFVTLHTFCTKVNLDWLLFVICGTLCDGVRPPQMDWLYAHLLLVNISAGVTALIQIGGSKSRRICNYHKTPNKQTTFWKTEEGIKRRGFLTPALQNVLFGSGELYKNNPGHILVVY